MKQMNNSFQPHVENIFGKSDFYRKEKNENLPGCPGKVEASGAR